MYIAIILGWPHINIVFDIDPIFKGSFGKNDHPKASALVPLKAICVLAKRVLIFAYVARYLFGGHPNKYSFMAHSKCSG